MSLLCQLDCAAPPLAISLEQPCADTFTDSCEGKKTSYCAMTAISGGSQGVVRWCRWVLGVQRPFNGIFLDAMGWQDVWAKLGLSFVQVERPRTNGAKIDQSGGLGRHARSVYRCRWAANGSLVQAGPAKTVTGCARRGLCWVRQRRGHKGSGVGAPRWAG